VLLAFGDSLTLRHRRKPRMKATLPSSRASRAGAWSAKGAGEVSEAGLARLPPHWTSIGPRLLLLCHGGNDFLRRLPRDQAAANLRAMISWRRRAAWKCC
jgi:lysophospholipase L1-like esterase